MIYMVLKYAFEVYRCDYYFFNELVLIIYINGYLADELELRNKAKYYTFVLLN